MNKETTDRNPLDTMPITPGDLAKFEEMDPSLSTPIHSRVITASQDTNQEVGTMESIRTRVLVQVGESIERGPDALKIELTSEADLFFHYTATIDEGVYSKLKAEQKLTTNLDGYANIVIKMMNQCQKDPQGYFAVFFMDREGGARLDFIQNMEYKFLELLSVEFVASSEEIIRQNITFRYNNLKTRVSFTKSKLKDVAALIKLKNPSLLLHLEKASAAGLQQSQDVGRSTMRPSASKVQNTSVLVPSSSQNKTKMMMLGTGSKPKGR